MKKKSEIFLEESELQIECEFLRSLINNVEEYIYIKDLRFKYLFVNDSFSNLISKNKEEIIGHDDFDFFPKEEVEFFHESDLKVITDGQSYFIDEQATVLDRKIWVSVSKYPLFNKNNIIIGIKGIVKDITQRRKTEEIIIKNEAKFHAIYDQALHLAGIVDLNGILIDANATARNFIGGDESSFIGKYFWETPWWTHSVEVQNQLKDGIQRALKGENVQFETTHYDANRNLQYIDFTLKPVFDELGNIFCLIPEGRNITNRKLAEIALKESEMTFRSLFDQSSEPNLLLKDGKFIDYNSSAINFLGYSSKEELMEKSPWTLSPPFQTDGKESNIKSKEMIELALEKGFHMFEWDHLRADNKILKVEVMLTVISIKGEKLLHVAWRDISKRKHAEDVLKDSEEKFRKLIETTDTGYVIINNQGVVVDANQKYVSLTGHQFLDEIMNHSVLEWTADHAIDTNSKAVQLCMKQGFIRNFEIDYVQKDGTIIPIEINATVVENESGTNILTLCRDIADRKKSELALMESEAKYKTLFESANDAIFILDNDCFLDCNDKTLDMFGCNKDQIVGHSPAELSPELQPDGDLSINKAMEKIQLAYSGIPQFFEWVHTHCDETTFQTEVSLNKVLIKNKYYLQAIVRDISKRKKAEDALRESEERFRELANLLPQIVFEIDMNGNLTFVNQIALNTFEYSIDDFQMGVSATTMLIKEDKERAQKNMANILKETSSTISEYTALRKNGTTFPVLVFSSSILQNNQPVGIRGIMVDITDRKLAEERITKLNAELEIRVEERTAELLDAMEELQETNIELLLLNDQVTQDSNKIQNLNSELIDSQEKLKEALSTKDKFFSIIAHDLKGPFTGFLGLTDLMAKETNDLSIKDMKRLSEIINKSANSVFHLIEDLLLWSRAQMGSIPYQPEELDIRDIAFNTVFSLKITAEIKNITLISLIDASNYIYCDRNMITSVLRNLVSNSIKFTPNNGNIEIGLIEDIENKKRIILYVKDNGIGINKFNIEKLFKLDEHYTTPGTNKEGGTGLGLLLCKEFIEKHGGEIWIESEENIGSTFYFSLPKESKY